MRKSFSIIALLVCIALIRPLAVGAADEKPVGKFKDVGTGYWARLMIEQAVVKGYVSGFSDGTFKPENKVTRAEFIKMLVDALKLPHVQAGSPWYQPYVAAAIETGIHKESDFKSKYDSSLTRLEMVRLAVRATMPGIDNNANSGDDNWLVFMGTQAGILAGTGAGKLELQGTSTRAQAVVIIERILSVNAGVKLPVDKYAMGSAELAWHRTNVFTVMPEFFRTQFSDEVQNKSDPIYSWDVSKMTVISNDGKYKGSINQVIAIDLADTKDPNRYLLGDINKLQWYGNGPILNGVAKGYPLNKQKDCYVILFNGHMDFNKDKKRYADEMPGFAIFGAFSSDKEGMEFYNGKLNKPASVFRKNITDFSAYVIPKKVQVKYDDLFIHVSTPSLNGVEVKSNEIIRVAGPGHPIVTP